TLNSYMYADAMAISRAAALLGDITKARRFAERATRLKRRVQEELWDPKRDFFFHQFAHDELNGIRAKSLTYETGGHAGNPHGRELLGYVPWQFNLPDSGYEAAWRFLMDPDYFFAPFGPTTVERHDPQFLISPRCCVWSGNQWPYATTQTLVAFANLLNNYEQDVVTKDEYFRLFRVYTLDQRMDGRPYIAEAANPDNGSWDGHNTFYHSEHYFHSAYVDLVITGLVGLRPRADDSLEVNPLVPDDWDYFALDDVEYHGHKVSVVWDRDGSRYGRGAGLSLFADGKRIANAPEVGRLVAYLGPPTTRPEIDRPINFAVNNGGRAYPLVTASYSAPTTPPHYAVDGNYWYHESPPNRWTAAGSGGTEDWIAVDFGIDRPVTSVRAYFYDDGREVRAPESYDLQYWHGDGWASVPRQNRTPAEPRGRRANVISFPLIGTSRMRLVLVHRAGTSSGLTELEIWGNHDLPLPAPATASRNIAFGGPDGRPSVTASYTHAGDRVEHVNDMRIAFTRYSRNRWTAYGSPNARDWVAIDFGEPRRVEIVDLFLYSDGRGVEVPRDYALEYRDAGRWTRLEVVSRVPNEPMGWARNRVRVVPVETERLRVLFEHALPAFTGVTEMMVWSRAPSR
ncbi:MAG: discoidin domain-containing protein, partial [Gemmatimonadales bacterium]